MLATGLDDAPQILIIPPLFGEMNRTRRLLADVMRALARHGIGSHLPDLPGTGESAAPLATIAWSDWEEAVREAAAVAARSGPLHLLAVRGGALLDCEPEAHSRWRLAPVAGNSLLRDLLRIRQLADAEDGAKSELGALHARAMRETLELAGYAVAPALSSGLSAAQPGDGDRTRSVTLADRTDYVAATLAGPPLWRRAEPGVSLELATAIADDVAEWVRTCADS